MDGDRKVELVDIQTGEISYINISQVSFERVFEDPIEMHVCVICDKPQGVTGGRKIIAKPWLCPSCKHKIRRAIGIGGADHV